jgi:hypothetical protein
MFAASGDSHRVETLFKLLDDTGDDGRVDVRYLGVIDIPNDRALGALDYAIANAWVIRVQHKTHVL